MKGPSFAISRREYHASGAGGATAGRLAPALAPNDPVIALASRGASKVRSRDHTAQTMRASLFA